MKKIFVLIITFFSALILSACTSQYCKTQVMQNCLTETWMHYIDPKPTGWLNSADSWFLTGNPVSFTAYLNPHTIAKKIDVRDFTNISIHGPFKVQIVSTPAQNQLLLIGPRYQLQQVEVEIQNNTLAIRVSADAIKNKLMPDQVIIRIAVRNLHELTNWGSCTIDGRNIVSDNLKINSYGGGKIFLQGKITLTSVTQYGPSEITILGVVSPALQIRISANRLLNICGRLGVQYIFNCNGHVKMIGVDSNSLIVDASGNSSTILHGFANLKQVKAVGNSDVYFYWVMSESTRVIANQNSRVGLAGYTGNLNVTLSGKALFYGKLLHSGSAYVQTFNESHANVRAGSKIFASASDRSSIYFFGPRDILSPFTSGNGSVIPMGSDILTPMS